MSLAEKWEEYRRVQEQTFTDGGPIEKLLLQSLQRAFYAGAEAALNRQSDMSLQIEIDRFKEKLGSQRP